MASSTATRTVLLADIGGTNCRFAVVGAHGRPDRIASIANDGVPDFSTAVAQYLAKTGARPQAGVLAVAAPVDGDVITLTNRAWCVRLSELAAEHGLSELRALNDFEAVAWSLPGLGPDDVKAIGSARDCGTGVRVVCGPGTGLGVAALIPHEGFWRVVPSEGGHMSFGAAAADEEPVFARLRERAGTISAETILSGPGLTRLHQAMYPDAGAVRPEEIITRAKSGDHNAQATVALFVRLLGRFAGDIALLFKATGAIYLAGGVGFAIASFIDAVEFRRAFEAHRPYERLLAGIPTFLMQDPEPGLAGCAVFASRMMAR
jgi:glucokinase